MTQVIFCIVPPNPELILTLLLILFLFSANNGLKISEWFTNLRAWTFEFLKIIYRLVEVKYIQNPILEPIAAWVPTRGTPMRYGDYFELDTTTLIDLF